MPVLQHANQNGKPNIPIFPTEVSVLQVYSYMDLCPLVIEKVSNTAGMYLQFTISANKSYEMTEKKKLEKALCFDMKSQNMILFDQTTSQSYIKPANTAKPLFGCINLNFWPFPLAFQIHLYYYSD